MDERITATEAKHNFTQLLCNVKKKDASYVVTFHGKPVAKLMPYEQSVEDNVRQAAMKAMIERWRNQPVFKVDPWTRDELYDC
jgi:prevent-host-death family protein